MRFTALASSSHGNAYVVDDGQSRLLLECGLARRTLQQRLGFQLSTLTAVLVSHEHKDHARCAAQLVADGMAVWMSEGTAEALELEGTRQLEAGVQVEIGSFGVMPFATFHDALEPLGFCVKSRADGETLVFATDTCNLAYRFPGVNLLAIEANYDPEILARCERIPDKVRRRITNSHMEIGRVCQYLRELDLSQCRQVYLLHLSDATSHEGHFIYKVQRAVPPGVAVTACGR